MVCFYYYCGVVVWCICFCYCVVVVVKCGCDCGVVVTWLSLCGCCYCGWLLYKVVVV